MRKFFGVVFLVGILLGVTSCVYIGLLPNEVKKHNEKIMEQLDTFPLDTYSGEYYFKESDGSSVSIQFCSKEDGVEFFIITGYELYYTDMIHTIKFEFETKEESSVDGICPYYEDTYADIGDIIAVVQAFDGSSDKSSGRRGIDSVGDDILDEVTHYCYNMDWKYSDVAMFDFYVSSKTSKLYYINLRDISNDGGFGKPHFTIRFDQALDKSLLDEYEAYKEHVATWDAPNHTGEEI